MIILKHKIVAVVQETIKHLPRKQLLYAMQSKTVCDTYVETVEIQSHAF